MINNELVTFIEKGEYHKIKVGMKKNDLLKEISKPLITEPQKKSYPEILFYGSLQVRLRESIVTGFTVDLTQARYNDSFLIDEKISQKEILSFLRHKNIQFVENTSFSIEGNLLLIIKDHHNLGFSNGVLTVFGV